MGLELLGLQAQEICRIIKVCQKSRVLSLELGSIKIVFQGPKEKGVPKDGEKTSEASLGVSLNGLTGAPDIIPPVSLLTPSDQEALEEAERSQLMIDDPTRFEQLMVDDHLQRPSRMSVDEANRDRRA